jgi:hypothetical protein
MFNPMTYWWQWWMEQMDGAGDGGGMGAVPRLSLRLGLATQLAGLEAYQATLKATQGETLKAMGDVFRQAAEAMVDAGVKSQKASLDAHIKMVGQMIAKLKEEVERLGQEGGKEGKTDPSGAAPETE